MIVLGVDPGKVSGWALVEAFSDKLHVLDWGEAATLDDRVKAIARAWRAEEMFMENSGNFGFVRATMSLADSRARWDELWSLYPFDRPVPTLVMPRVWQQRLGYVKGGIDKDTKAFSKRLAADALGAFGGSEHANDAACIALYGLLALQHPQQRAKKKAPKKRKATPRGTRP